MSSNLISYSKYASFLLVLVVNIITVHTAAIENNSGDLTEDSLKIFDNWLNLLRLSLVEADIDVDKPLAVAPFEELKNSISGHVMKNYGQDAVAMDVLKEFLFDTRVKVLLFNESHRQTSQDLYQSGEKMISAMRDHLPIKLNRGTLCEFLHSARKHHLDDEEVYVFLARLIKQLHWKGMHVEQSLHDATNNATAQWKTLQQQQQQH